MTLPERLDEIAGKLLKTKDYSTFAHAIYQAAIELRQSSGKPLSGTGLTAYEASVIAAAVHLSPLLEEGWDDQDTPEDRNKGAKACDALVDAVKAYLGQAKMANSSGKPGTEARHASRIVWVIEKGSPAQYFVRFDYGAGEWTDDFAKALYCSSREMAQQLWDCDVPIFTIFNDGCRITDHMICGGP